MDIRHSSEIVGNMVESYDSTIVDLGIVKDRVRDNYINLVERGWHGEAQEAFIIEYERWNSIFEIYIQRLEEMKRLLDEHKSHADTLRNTSIRKFANLF